MSAGRQKLGPSYDEEAYWEAKFKSAPAAFEWLGSGEVLLEAFREAHPSVKGVRLPRVLQLGAGTSSLSLNLAKYLLMSTRDDDDDDNDNDNGNGNDTDDKDSRLLATILNVDFSHEALLIGERQAQMQGLQGMQYLRLDLRIWKDLQSCPPLSEEPIDFIFDKSTSDAISTNAMICLNAPSVDEQTCPLLTSEVASELRAASLDPLDLVALHLAALSRPGCLWAVLSYSSNRFDFLHEPHCHSRPYWSLLRKEAVAAPSGSNNPSAPIVFHWFYLLQRCDFKQV